MLSSGMSKPVTLKELCPTKAIQTRIKNALWVENGYGVCAPTGWEPDIRDFLKLDVRYIDNIGPVSLKILQAWPAASE